MRTRRSVADRVRSIDADLEALGERGWAPLPELLEAAECRELAALFGRDELFRSTVDMGRHRFGSGVYRYFRDPLPPLVRELRRVLYGRLVQTANTWAQQLGASHPFPPTLRAFREQCAAAGQNRPTPLLLRYGAGDFNRLHQDLYGAIAFPFQVVIPLTGRASYGGGEFVLQEQPPRTQARVTVLRPEAGDGVVFANRFRPARGQRGYYRVTVRHGLSTLTRGSRVALGVIFHDAA